MKIEKKSQWETSFTYCLYYTLGYQSPFILCRIEGAFVPVIRFMLTKKIKNDIELFVSDIITKL